MIQISVVTTAMNKMIPHQEPVKMRVVRLTLEANRRAYDIDVMEDGTENFSVNLRHMPRAEFPTTGVAKILTDIYDAYRDEILAYSHDAENHEAIFENLRTRIIGEVSAIVMHQTSGQPRD